MRPSCVVVLMFAIVACRGSHGNRPDGSIDGAPDASADGSPDASIDAPADVPPDAPIDGAVVPVACSALTAPRIGTAGSPSGVAVADVNGDGKPDLLVTVLGVPSESTVLEALDVMLGNGDGSFQPARRTVIDPEGRAAARAPAVADIDGDGDLDVVIALSKLDASAVQLVLGDGLGNFTLGSRLAGAFPSSISLGDLDRDGYVDIITVSGEMTSGVSILFGTGAGSFATPIALDAATAYDSVVIGDVDHDQIPDVVAAGDSLGVFRGHGDRTFEPPFNIALAAVFARDVAVGDLNGDGNADIVTAGRQFNDWLIVETWLGSGTGTFAKRDERSFIPDHPSDLPGPCCLIPSFPGVLALGDYDADSKLDVAVTFVHRDDVNVMKGTGTGDLPSVTQFATGREPLALASADVNGDGRLDLIATDTTQHVEIMLGTPNGIFRAPRNIRSFADNEGRPLLLAVGDIDGDGQLDFAEGVATFDLRQDFAMISIMGSIAGSGGNFFLPSHFGGNVRDQDLLLRDVDADGDLDMIATSTDAGGPGDVSVFFNSGNGRFGTRKDTRIMESVRDLAIGNLDADPQLEAVVGVTDNSTTGARSLKVLKLNNDGSGTFSELTSIADGGALLLQDFNGDGRLDLATYGSASTIRVRLGKGDGTFESPIDSGVPSMGRVVVADLNDDGVPDLAGEAGSFTAFFTGNGNGTFVSAGTAPLAPGGLIALANIDNVAPLDVVGALGVVYRAGNDTRTDDWPMLATEPRDVSRDGHLDVVGVGFSVQAGPRSNAVFLLESQCQ